MNQFSITIKYWLLGKLSPLYFLNKEKGILGNLRTFCGFVGHGRSGSTLVGHLLNAHPNIVIANELHSFRMLSRGLSEKELYRLIYLVSGRQVSRGSKGGGGYGYSVPNQWQGRHGEVQVIGDRKAGATAWEIFKNPQVLQKVSQVISLEKKFIHVMRNPFDAITTSFKKTKQLSNETEHQHLEREIDHFFIRCAAVKRVKAEFGEDALFLLRHETLINDPRGALSSLCSFLNVDCTEDYLDDCASIILVKPHKTRDSIEWDNELKEKVESKMVKFEWLNFYLSRDNS